MNSLCPHTHVSYAAWRLSVLNALVASCGSQPTLHLDFLGSHPAYARSRPRRRFAGSSSKKKENHISENESRKDEHDQGLLEAALGRGSTPLNRVESVRGNAAEEGTVRDVERHSAASVLEDNELASCPPPNTFSNATKRAKQEQWTPFSEHGQADLKSLVQSLRKSATKALEGDVPFEPHQRLSTLLPESPVLRRTNMIRKHKLPAPKTELEPLADNPWARMLASPIRTCQATGVKLPRDLFISWGFVRNPSDQQVYLMPDELAEIEHLRRAPSGHVSMDAIPTISTPKSNSIHGVTAAPVDLSSEETSDEHMNERSPIASDAVGSREGSVVSRLLTLPLSALSRHLTELFIGQPDNFGIRHTKKGSVSRLFSERWKKSLAAAATKAGETQRPAKTDDSGASSVADGMSHSTAGASEDIIHVSNIKWQSDIDTRLLKILQRRVLAAIEGLARQNNSNRAKHGRRVVALNIPDDNSNRSAGQEQFTEDDSPEPRLQGSFLLHLGPAEFPMSNSYALPLDLRADLTLHHGPQPDSLSQLQSLPSHPFIPPSIGVKHLLRLPVFSLQRLLGPEYSAKFGDLAQEFSQLAPPSRRIEPDAGTDRANQEAAIGKDYVLLIKATAPGANTLANELWRLWRYVGGNTDTVATYSGDIFNYRQGQAELEEAAAAAMLQRPVPGADEAAPANAEQQESEPSIWRPVGALSDLPEDRKVYRRIRAGIETFQIRRVQAPVDPQWRADWKQRQNSRSMGLS